MVPTGSTSGRTHAFKSQERFVLRELVLLLLLLLPVKVLPLSCYSYDIPIPEISGDVGVLVKATGGFLNHFSIFVLGKWASLLVLDFFFPTFSDFSDNFQAD